MDTAGIRDTSDIVEKIGVDKAKENAEKADLIIYVVDASRPLDENDHEIIEMIRDKKAVILLNKSDLSTVVDKKALETLITKPMIDISAKEETGIHELESTLKEMFYHGDICLRKTRSENDCFHRKCRKYRHDAMQPEYRRYLKGAPGT